jgi:serine/threonine protein kinase/Flp pilus assembly protein TadD
MKGVISKEDADVTLESPHIEGPGTMIGRYKLLQLIGEGGMGLVYLAEQQEPIRRRAALKIVKLGMDTKQVIARFEAEKQVLALLDHPNIARVYDAGTTEAGRPYFVMEYVKGQSITEYCDQHKTSIEERLKLFRQVCEGVQHAHQKGIIHRDIKPSNILVSIQGDKAIPKIIDFGIAKAVTQPLTERTLFTERGQLLGTPEYMSPEQVDMATQDIDTRSDIYSLGVLLYELLTGTLPFDRKTLEGAGFGEIQRIIREEDPPRPSTRLSSLGEEATKIAASRRTEVAKLAKRLHKELEWIPLKAIRKERTHRYRSASELADDIQNYLNGAPLIAGPESATYRLKKVIKRHRALVTGVAAVLIVLVAGVVVSTIFAIGQAHARAEAERQAMISQAVNEFLNRDLLASVDPDKAKGREVTVLEVLDAAAQKIGGKFKDAPSVEASIRDTLGTTYMSLGRCRAAEPHLERALELRRGQFGGEHPDTLKSMNSLGVLYFAQHRYNEAEPLLVKALEGRRRVLGEENPNTQTSMNSLALLYECQERYNEAEQLFVKALEIGRRVLGEEHPRTLSSMHNLAQLYHNQGRYNDAEPLYVKALEIQRRVLGEEHPATLVSMNNLGGLYENQERYNEAELLFVKMLEIGRRVLGEEHPNTLSFMDSLGSVYFYQVRYNEAEPLFVKALEGKGRVLGEEHPSTLWSMHSLAELYDRQGRYNEAEPLFVKLLEIQRRVCGEKHPDTLNYIKNFTMLVEHLGSLGMEEYKAGAYEEAVATLNRVNEYRRTFFNNEFHPRDIAYIAMALHQLGRAEEAKVALDRLRTLLKDEQFAQDEQAKAFLAEAEKLIEGKE